MTDRFSHKVADNYRLEVSGLFIIPSADTYDIIRIPKWGFVHDVWLEVTAVCTALGTITVGWKGNGESAQTAGFISNDIARPERAGLKRAQQDNLLSFPGKYFSGGSGAITLTVAGTTLVVGQFRVFAGYSVIM